MRVGRIAVAGSVAMRVGSGVGVGAAQDERRMAVRKIRNFRL
jgi:hypothetical protein